MVFIYDKKFSKKSPASESHECFSINEVRQKLDVEFSKNRVQLFKMAKRHCNKLTIMESEDLIQETYKRFIAGTRRWRKDLQFIQVFNGAMRSISDEEYKIEQKTVSENKIKNDKEYSIYENTPDQAQNPKEEIIYKQEQEVFKEIVKKLLKDDKVAQDFFRLYYLEDCSRAEIMDKLQISNRQYNAVCKKVRRRIDKIRE